MFVSFFIHVCVITNYTFFPYAIVVDVVVAVRSYEWIVINI